MKMRKVKCPNPKCKYEWMQDVEKIYNGGKTPVLRALTPTPPSPKIEKFVDLVCPNCKEEFEYRWED